MPPPLAAEVDGLRRAVGDGSLRRIPAHLTLVPPVNVAEDRLPDALAVLRGAAAHSAPIALDLGPPGTFLPDNPVLYLGVEGEVGAVHALRGRVMREPLARSAAWSFVPHVTLADEASTEVIESAMVALARYRAPVRFERVHLLRQRPDRVWEPIAEAPLRPPTVIGRGGIPLELAVTTQLDAEAVSFCEGQGATERPFAVTARRDRHVVGVATGVIEGQRAHLDRLVVGSPQRRQGIGSRLLAEVESLAAEHDCRFVYARAPASPEAEAFLRFRGWTEEACFYRDLGSATPSRSRRC